MGARPSPSSQEPRSFDTYTRRRHRRRRTVDVQTRMLCNNGPQTCAADVGGSVPEPGGRFRHIIHGSLEGAGARLGSSRLGLKRKITSASAPQHSTPSSTPRPSSVSCGRLTGCSRRCARAGAWRAAATLLTRTPRRAPVRFSPAGQRRRNESYHTLASPAAKTLLGRAGIVGRRPPGEVGGSRACRPVWRAARAACSALAHRLLMRWPRRAARRSCHGSRAPANTCPTRRLFTALSAGCQQSTRRRRDQGGCKRGLGNDRDPDLSVMCRTYGPCAPGSPSQQQHPATPLPQPASPARAAAGQTPTSSVCRSARWLWP